MRAVIRAYQLLIVPVLPAGGCRFQPTCSHYALDAIDGHGALTGGWLAVKRILRCHPWGDAGFDPVPPAKAKVSAATTSHKTPEQCNCMAMTKTTEIITG
ncbi:MAG: membrane protein insertion efficiency factor YidD [Rhodospirillales bacterium]|nr:membrane protein insertion efficiency factor YidD [Alphaproteobacteria bacterium]MBL6948675.1 membrane protein insertion efficiency factor YidD [Rhodospirillales bacterium]